MNPAASLLLAALLAPGQASVEEEAARGAVEEVVVEARRLEGEAPGGEGLPNVTVLDQEEIRASGSRTLQQALDERPEVQVFDQVGNGVESDIELRGFNDGTHVAFVVDGVRLNAPDDNRADLEMLFLDEVDRVEVRRGAGSSLFGAGAGAGVVRVRTRPVPEGAGGEAYGSAGSWRTLTGGARGWGGLGSMRIMGAVERTASDGYRTNGDYGLTRGRLRAEGPVGGGRLAATFHHSDLSAGNPQSLKEEEWEEDPEGAPWNQTDYHDAGLNLFVLRYDGGTGPWTFSGHAAFRDQNDGILTTGRLGAGRRGFLTDTATTSLEMVVQATRAADRWEAVAGLEARRARIGARGWETDLEGGDSIAVSDTETRTRSAGLFAQGALRLGRHWRLEGGLRWDGLRVAMDSRMEGARAGDERRWAVPSPRIAFTRRVRRGGWSGAWLVSLSRGFLLPTPNDLFAFPGYGSNPDLEPTRVHDLEAGWSGSIPGGGTLSAVAFRMDVRDEVFFDWGDTGGAFGRNVGRDTRRTGLEVSGETPLGRRCVLGAGYTWIDATYEDAWRTAGGDEVEPGDRIPLVPQHKAALWLRARPGAGWRLRLHGRWVGERNLDNDPAGRGEPLPPYQVWDLAAAWSPERLPALTLRLAARNILDERYASRGIAGVPDQNGVPNDFYTPAPGRYLEAGLRFHF